MQIPTPPEEFSLKETNPHLGGEKVTGYELVEQIQYLYVRVVKAKDLPEKYVTGTCDPYLEVKTGSTKVTTPRFENNWNQVFAISKDRVQSSVIEVIVKDKDIENANNAFMGRVSFELNRVPRRVPPDNPLAPQWYSFDNDRGKKVEGELMLAVWTGTQADEAFSEAWCSDAFGVSGTDDIANIRSRVYFSPKLSYVLKSRISPRRTVNPLWNEDLIFVVAEPFDEPLILSVEDRVAPDKDELLGRCKIPFQDVDWRLDYFKPSVIRSYELETHVVTEGDQEEETKFASRILVCICLEGGYHVLDESTKYCSDFRPTAEELRRPKIGVLELGILEAKELAPMKTKDEVGTTDAYCVAKYGDKSRGLKDSRIGKVRIRLSTLETNRVYTHLYPLLVLHPSGVKKMGEIHLAVRFTFSSLLNMMHTYSQPLFPKMHHILPLNVSQLDYLRHQATQIISMRLSLTEPPLRKEVVEYILDVGSYMWSMRKSKLNFFRVMSVLSLLNIVINWFERVCYWGNPKTTILIHIMYMMLVIYPELILPAIFLCPFLIGAWYYRQRPRYPPHIDVRPSHAESAIPDDLDEEFDTLPTSRSSDLVRMRYDHLRGIAGRIQTVVDDVASQGERLLSLLSWRDPRATALYMIIHLVAAIVVYVTPFKVVTLLTGFYVLRHPRFRRRRWLPSIESILMNFFKRLPARTDCIL
ncbi:ft-interacting protein 1 [Quercus suber]|uniref:Ft-interacting protein 1 n=1 Tax=Quercus suber TaxID=58331 RepID=A0AAW0M6T8_QUESU